MQSDLEARAKLVAPPHPPSLYELRRTRVGRGTPSEPREVGSNWPAEETVSLAVPSAYNTAAAVPASSNCATVASHAAGALAAGRQQKSGGMHGMTGVINSGAVRLSASGVALTRGLSG